MLLLWYTCSFHRALPSQYIVSVEVRRVTLWCLLPKAGGVKMLTRTNLKGYNSHLVKEKTSKLFTGMAEEKNKKSKTIQLVNRAGPGLTMFNMLTTWLHTLF